MPRTTDHVPKYSRHKGSGQAVVTIRGRDQYLGPYGSKASRMWGCLGIFLFRRDRMRKGRRHRHELRIAAVDIPS